MISGWQRLFAATSGSGPGVFQEAPWHVLFKAFRHAFSVAEFQQLRQGNCLQDDVVNQFIQLLQERCALLGDRVWIAQTFFHSQLTGTKFGPKPPRATTRQTTKENTA